MEAQSGDEPWSTPLQHRIQSCRSQLHARSSQKDPVGDATFLSEVRGTLEALYAFSRELNTCINAMSPVLRLSPEVLSLVFHALSRELPIAPRYVAYGKDYEGCNETNLLSTWIKVTHVSRYWREVALSDTSLWTEVSATHGAYWTEALLKRSGSQTLTLHLGGNIPSNVQTHPVWDDAISRTRALQVGSLEFSWPDRFLGIIADSLTDLRIHVATCESHEGSADCPPRFFKTDLHELRELELCGFGGYQWSSLLRYPALTTLKLGTFSDNYWVEVGVTLRKFLDTLSQLHSLQTLTLLGLADITAEPEIDHHTDSVHLSHLQLLRLESCHPTTLLALLDAIVTPACAKTRLISDTQWWSVFYGYALCTAKFLDILKRRLSILPCYGLQTVVVSSMEYLPQHMQLGSGNGIDSITTLAWREDIDPHHLFRSPCQDETRRPEPDFYFRVFYKLEEKDYRPIYLTEGLLSLFAQVPIRNLCLLPGRTFISNFSWDKISTTFPALRHLGTCNEMSLNIILDLYKDCQATSTPRLPLKIPQLEKLSFLHGTNSYAYWLARKFEDSSSGASYTFAQLLERICQFRLEQGLTTEIFVDDAFARNRSFDSASDTSMFHPVEFIRLD